MEMAKLVSPASHSRERILAVIFPPPLKIPPLMCLSSAEEVVWHLHLHKEMSSSSVVRVAVWKIVFEQSLHRWQRRISILLALVALLILLCSPHLRLTG